MGRLTLVIPQILSLGSVLTKTLHDIRIWTPRTLGLKKIVASLVPRKVIEIIREDERKIMQQLVILMFALSTTSNHHPGSGRTAKDNSKPNALKWIRNPEVADFWATYVGRHVLNPSQYQLTVRYFMFRQPISVEFGCEMCIRLFLYPAVHTEYMDDNSVYSEILAVHPGGAVAITLT